MKNTEIYDKITGGLIKIIYNPYDLSVKEIINFWIPCKFQKEVRGKNINIKK